MLFSIIAKTFEKIESTKSRLEMTEIYSNLLKISNIDEVDKIIYLSQGEITPSFIGITIGMGERFVLQAISISTGYEKSIIEKEYKKTGDLGLVCYNFIKKRKQQTLFTQKLTLKKVYDVFLKIAKIEGEKSQQYKINYLIELLNYANEIEGLYICRFVVSKLRLGIGDPTILDALSWTKQKDKSLREDLERAYNVCSDLGLVAKLFLENEKLIYDLKVSVFIPVRPALAERENTIKDLIKRLGICAIDSKYDGLRLQIHKKNEKVKVFSRKLEDMTLMFPEIVNAIKELKQNEIIIEGEALAYDMKKEKYLNFQETIRRRRKYNIEEMSKTTPLKLFIFDILLLEGKDLTNIEYSKRREIIENIILSNIQHSDFKNLTLSEQIISNDEKQIEKFYQDRLDKGLEGIIAKDLNAKYSAGKRGFSWIKLKKSYGLMVDTLDCVILGYFVGKGHRAEFEFGGLLVGTYNKHRDIFETVAKIGSGFSEEEMIILKEMLKKEIVREKPKNIESIIEPDYFVNPTKIVEVMYDEITVSPIHTCSMINKQGLALRFPRMKMLREDKSIYEATTSDEVLHMYNKINKGD